jgi:hypothetical protein
MALYGQRFSTIFIIGRKILGMDILPEMNGQVISRKKPVNDAAINFHGFKHSFRFA